MCFNFDHEKYSAVQEAYRRLGKTRIAIDQLHMHYTSAVHSASFDTINLFVDSERVENNKNSFALLCQVVHLIFFILSLIVFEIMLLIVQNSVFLMNS